MQRIKAKAAVAVRHDNIIMQFSRNTTPPKPSIMQRTPGYSQANDKVTEMNSLAMIMNKAIINGYTEQFKVGSRGFHAAEEGSPVYAPENISIINFYRFEGESDPGDNAILYVIETSDGKKGTLVDAYGPYADAKVTAFMQQVEDIQKKVVKEDTESDLPKAEAA